MAEEETTTSEWETDLKKPGNMSESEENGFHCLMVGSLNQGFIVEECCKSSESDKTETQGASIASHLQSHLASDPQIF